MTFFRTTRCIATATIVVFAAIQGGLRPSGGETPPAQTPVLPTPEAVAKALGFTDSEIRKIKGGEVIIKQLNEGSDKELAGVVAVFFKKPVGELADVALQGKLLETDKSIQAFHTWKPDESADTAFAKVGLDAKETAEAKYFSKASPGDKLNLSPAEIAQFKNVQPTPEAVNVPLRAMLKARYEAYLQKGLKGITPYARKQNEVSPAKELTLAIRETMAVAPRKEFFEALLNYPAAQPADIQHRFSWFKQTVENRPTFILAHRVEHHMDRAALLTEVQFYVGHSFNSNFIAGGGLSVEGGTLVFYINRTFTDQVAGPGSGMKHSIGRDKMLSEVTSNLQRFREALQK